MQFQIVISRQMVIKNRAFDNAPNTGKNRAVSACIEVQNLSKSIDGCPILKNICMRVKQGEIYGFPGANGAGKTSLMKTLYHIIRPYGFIACF